MLESLILVQIYGRHTGTGEDLRWIHWHWGRFMVDTVALEKVSGGRSGTKPDFPLTIVVSSSHSSFRQCSYSSVVRHILVYTANGPVSLHSN
jgi:hypothetical protein